MRLVRFVHRCYKRLLSPLFGNACRFEPYCSDYALKAIETHGYVRGIFLACRRVLRCHPFNPGGYDPVPPHPGEKAGREERPNSYGR